MTRLKSHQESQRSGPPSEQALAGRNEMRKGIFGLLMMFLILTSAFLVGFAVKPAKAQIEQRSDSGIPLSNGTGNVPQASSTSNSVNSSISSGGFNELNFNDTSAWSKSAYLDGNMTRLIVGIKDEASGSLSGLEKLAVKYGAKIVDSVSMRGKIAADVVELLLPSVTPFVNDVQSAGWASYVEPNMKVQCQFVPNDPLWSLQWGPKKIQADWAWNTTVGSSSVLVAVLDTGIDYNHPDLAANYVPLGYNWAYNNSDPKDDFGHGTHCAGIIAAELNNSIGIAGMAQVHIMAEKVLDSGGYGYEDWVANGIIHATDMGANIISMSFGGYGDSELIHDAVKYAYSAGVMLVAAAGNDHTDTKSYPAAYPEVVSVAATDQNDNPAYFSNFGDWIELAAPGVDIYSTMPTYQVTLNYYGYSMNYTSLSGTSMACPHVSGLAALVLSLYSQKSRDWRRVWLRYTADDLGAPGFDMYYGYGRIDARNAVETPPPAHDVISYGWETPPYIEPPASAMINGTVLNFGGNDESNVTVQLLANGSVVDSATIGFLANGTTATVGFDWNPTVLGSYNVTLYVVPVPGETRVENNILSKIIYVGHPVKVFVLRSAGNVEAQSITNWQVLSNEWYRYGNTMVYVDYVSLNKVNITYQDLEASKADVLVISCAFASYMGWEYTDSEIEAITQYVHEGHGLIVTAGTFYSAVPNNNKLAPLLGINDQITWTATFTDLMDLVNTSDPFLNKVPDPLVFPQVGSAIPSSNTWDQNTLAGGSYLALGHFEESAVVTFRGLVYISAWLEQIPAYYKHHLQLLYNVMLYSRYQKPEHELVVTLAAPKRVDPNEFTLLNATVANEGLNDETNVLLQLFIDGTSVGSVTIPDLPAGSLYTLSIPWTPSVEGSYNVTAYAPPLLGEEFIQNNVVEQSILVVPIVVKNCLVYSDDYVVSPSARYVISALDDLAINYTYFADDPFGFIQALHNQTWDLVVVDHCNYFPLEFAWPLLDTYVQNGGLLVLSTFAVDNPSSLWHTLGVSWASEMLGRPEQVYRWVPQHSMFTFPNVIGDLTPSTRNYYDEGDHVNVTTGAALGGFTTMPNDGEAGIIAANAHRTVLFSFILDEFRLDLNGSGKVDAERLWENAIVYVARSHEHNIAVSLEAQTALNSGASMFVNATVKNTGLQNETNVELQLFINETVVDDASVSSLPSGVSYTMTYTWTPADGIYNVTAYAPPVPYEDTVEDNVASETVRVFQAKGFVLFDQTHGTDSIGDYSIWVSNLNPRGYLVDGYSSGPITPDALKGYNVFVIPQAHASYNSSELTAIQSFVMGGGELLVIGGDDPWYYNDLTSFAGIFWINYAVGGYTSDITPHPLTRGVSTAYFAVPTSSLTVGGPPASTLIRDTGGYGMVSEAEIGSGRVIALADQKSVVDWCIDTVDNLRLANNMIDWEFAPATVHEVAVTAIQVSQDTAYEGHTVGVNVTVANLGEVMETFSVSTYYDTNVIATQLVTDLAPNANLTLNFAWNTSGVTPHALYNYTISAQIPAVPDEVDLSNNKLTDGTVRIKILGDMNGDGTVNLADLVLLAHAYGSHVGDTNYNPEADFKDTGTIGLVDLVTCAIHYSETAQP
jgi:thermitase